MKHFAETLGLGMKGKLDEEDACWRTRWSHVVVEEVCARVLFILSILKSGSRVIICAEVACARSALAASLAK